MTKGASIAADGFGDLKEIARQLTNVRNAQRESRKRGGTARFPRRDSVVRATELLTHALFPQRLGSFSGTGSEEHAFIESRLAEGLQSLTPELQSEAAYWDAESGSSPKIEGVNRRLQTFASSLVRVRILVDSDIEAAFLGDPAARTIDEILVSYPGAHAILWHRLAHELYRLGAPIVARIISEAANERTGIDIHPGAQIGPAFFIDHGSGVVIGETARIGARVRLYQQVTLGGRAPDGSQLNQQQATARRHPQIGDDVVIYAGATILGAVTIGSDSVIGGNCWILHDVPDDAVVQVTAASVDVGQAATQARRQVIGVGTAIEQSQLEYDDHRVGR